MKIVIEDDVKIAAREDVTPKEGESQYGDVTFADEKNKKYPIDTEEHIRSAWNYINKPDNAGKYSEEDVTRIKGRIIRAWKDKIDPAGPPSAEKSGSAKLGARHSGRDQQNVQAIHDAATDLGAACDPATMSVETEELVAFGGPIKAVKLDDGSVKLGGYLVSFRDENETDLTGEFFPSDGDYGDAEKADVFFNHRMPVRVGEDEIEYKSKLGKATLRRDDAGYFAEVILKARNAYEQAIVDAGLAGQLGWSSGTAGHLVEREQVGKAMKLSAWPLGLDASLTPTPAEPRLSNMVIPLKTLSVSQQALNAQGGQAKTQSAGDPVSVKSKSENGVEKMEFTKEELQTLVADASKSAADEAVKAYIEKTEPVTGSGIKVTKDAGDQPFATERDFFMAVKAAGIHPAQTDPRLLALKAPAGMSESVDSDGGFLLLPQMSANIMTRMYTQGAVLSRVSKDPIGPNSNAMLYNGIDETSRATGSRWGGLQGYWLAEGGSLTGSKPKFYQVPLKLKKVGALAYATDEQLMDSTALAAWLNRTVPQELTFQVEDAVFNGVGAGMPLGITQSACLISVTRLDANKIQIQDVSGMLARVWMGSQPGTLGEGLVWFADQSVIPQLAQLVIGNYPAFLPISQGLTGPLPATLLGRPIVFVEYMSALGTANDLMLCDMSQYQMIDKGGVEQASSIHVNFLTDEQVFRFIYRIDGAPLWKAAVTPKNGGSTLSPFVSLTTAT